MKNSFELIYDVVRRIPRGKVATYGQIAMLAGNPRWSRVVGYALHVNPDPAPSPSAALTSKYCYCKRTASNSSTAESTLKNTSGTDMKKETTLKSCLLSFLLIYSYIIFEAARTAEG